MKTLIAATLSATLALTSVPTMALANDREDQIAQVLFGLAALAVLGAAIENRGDHRPKARVTVRTPNYSPTDGIRIPTNRRVLPAQCVVEVRTPTGPVRMFGRRCLQNSYAFTDRLPQRCAISVEGPRHTRYGFRPRCLRNFGFTRS